MRTRGDYLRLILLAKVRAAGGMDANRESLAAACGAIAWAALAVGVSCASRFTASGLARVKTPAAAWPPVGLGAAACGEAKKQA